MAAATRASFSSRKSRYVAEVRLSEIAGLDLETIDLDALKNANIVPRTTKTARVILSGEIARPVTLSGLVVTKGSRQAIEQAGGQVED